MIDRRIFLRRSAILAAVLASPAIGRAAVINPYEKSLNLFNTHTGEIFNGVVWANGQFLPDALDAINYVLRDHRSNQVMAIDRNLLSLLERISTQTGAGNALHIISGYRSPETNRLLADRTDGVAKHSLHLEGRAIDIRIPGCDLATVQKVAMNLYGGGVGFYPKSQFVHIDTGRVRTW